MDRWNMEIEDVNVSEFFNPAWCPPLQVCFLPGPGGLCASLDISEATIPGLVECSTIYYLPSEPSLANGSLVEDGCKLIFEYKSIYHSSWGLGGPGSYAAVVEDTGYVNLGGRHSMSPSYNSVEEINTPSLRTNQ